MMEWISVKDSLPENGDTVVIFTKSQNVYAVPYWNGFNQLEWLSEESQKEWDMTESVLYWFKPTLPKGAKNEA